MFDSYAVPEAPIGGHLYRQQVGVKVILASMQQKVGISVSALCAGVSVILASIQKKVGISVSALCVHYVYTLCALCVRSMAAS